MRLANESKNKYATREKNPTNDDNMIYYSEDYPVDYIISVDGERIISLPSIPVGAQIIRIDYNIQTVPVAAYGWNPTSRILTFALITTTDGFLATFTAGELLSIIYKIKKTTL